MALTYFGYIEEFEVRDYATEEAWPFSDFDEATKFVYKRRASFPENRITLVAVLDSREHA